MYLSQSTAARRPFKLVLSSDHATPATGKTVAVTISRNGGAFANPSAGATNATEIGNGWYYVDLSTTDTATLGPLVVKGTSATCDDAGIADDVALPVLSTIPGGTGTATAGAATTITLQTDIGNGSGIGGVIVITGGTGVGQFRGISSYAFSTRILTVDRAWQTNPDNTSTYAIYPGEFTPLNTALAVTTVATTSVATSATVGGFNNAGFNAMLKMIWGISANAGNALWIVDPIHGSSGGAGTWASPYDTILTAVNNGMSAGDKVLMLAGTQALGNNVVTMPDGVDVFGVSRQGCIITSTAVLTSKGVIFCPGSNTVNRNFTVTAAASQPGGVGFPIFQACIGAYGSAQGFTNALIENVDLNGGSDVIYLDSGLKTTTLHVRDAKITTGWDFVAVENFNSGNNTNANIVVNNTLCLEHFQSYGTGASSGGFPYLPEGGGLSFGVNVVNEYKGGGTALTRGSVAAYLKHGYISTYTTDAGINSRPLAVQGPLATLDVDDVDIVQFNSGAGGVINDAYAISDSNGKCYLTLSNVRCKYSTISVDANSSLVLRSNLGNDAGYPNVGDVTGKVIGGGSSAIVGVGVESNMIWVGGTPQTAIDLGSVLNTINTKVDVYVSSRAVPGDQMDLVNAPNSMAVTAIVTAVWSALNSTYGPAIAESVWSLLFSDVAFTADPATIGSVIASLTEPDPTTASKYRLTTKSLVNAPTGGPSGPSAVTLTFVDSASAPVPNVQFTVPGQGSMRSNSSGVAAFGLDDGSYTVLAAPTNLVLFPTTALTVSGTTALTVTGSSTSLPDPPSANQVTAFTYVRDAHGNLVTTENVVLTFQMATPDSPSVWDETPFTVTSDNTGLVSTTLEASSKYRARTVEGNWVEFTTGSSTPYQIPAILGRID